MIITVEFEMQDANKQGPNQPPPAKLTTEIYSDKPMDHSEISVKIHSVYGRRGYFVQNVRVKQVQIGEVIEVPPTQITKEVQLD